MKTITFIKNGLLTVFFVLISLATTFAVEVTVNFTNSSNNPIEGGVVQYKDYNNNQVWTYLGTTDVNGQVIEDLDPNANGMASLRLLWEGRETKLFQNINENSVFNFFTVAVTMKLISSQSIELESTLAEYYNAGWVPFGNGITTETVELLSGNYNFRITYNGGRVKKTQDISIDPIVIFNTVNVTFYFTGDIEYYSSGLNIFNGPSMELLPREYNFRFIGEGSHTTVYKDITISEDGLEKSVEYVKFRSSQSVNIEGASTQFNSFGWEAGNITNNLGACINLIEGYVEEVTTRLYYGGTSEDIVQDISDDSFIDFNTVLVTMDLNNSLGDPLESSNAEYYANGWQQFGDGVTSESMELLAQDYNFRVSYSNGSESKHQDVSIDANVFFETVSVTTNLFDSNGIDLESDDVTYSSDGISWMQFGDGITSETIELLADDYIFRMEYAGASIDKDQDVGDNAVVNFATVPVTMNVYDGNNNVLEGTDAMYNFSGWNTFGAGTTPEVVELLPVVYDFKATFDEDEMTVTQNTAFNPNVSFTEESEEALIVNDNDESDLLDDDEIMEEEFVYEKSGSNSDLKSTADLQTNVYPNPFSESITLSYEVELDSKVNISIYNMNGVLITTLVNKKMVKGLYEVKWNADDATGNDVPNGIYVYKITIDNKVESNTMILQK